MTDFATLVLGTDSSGLKQGAQALDALVAKADTAEAKVVKTNRGMSNAADLLAATVRAATAAETVARMASADAAQRVADRVDAAAQARIRAEQSAAEAVARAARQEAAARESLIASYSQLRASLDPVYAASMQYERATETVNAAVKAQIVTQEQANRVLMQAEKAYLSISPAAAKVASAARTAGAEMATVGRSSSAMGFAVQNSAFQIGDMAVQIAGGTSAMRAMSMQLPQLLGGFGVWGAVIGGVVAVGGALAPMLFGAGKAAKDAGEGLDNANAALVEFQANAKLAMTDTAELTKRFGQWGDQIAFNAKMMAEQNIVNAQAALQSGEMVSGLSDVVSAQAGAQDALGKYLKAQRDMKNGIQGSADAALAAHDMMELYNGDMNNAARAMGLTADQALTLNNAMDAIKMAKGPAAMADAANAALQVFYAIPPEVISASDALKDAEGEVFKLAQSAAQAAVTAKAMTDAFSPAKAILDSLFASDAPGNWLQNALVRAGLLVGKLMDAARAAAAADLLATSPALTGPAGMTTGESPEGQHAAKLAAAESIAAKIRASYNQVATAAHAAAGGAKAVKEELTDAEKAAQAFADAMTNQVKSGVEGTVDWFLNGFKDGLSGLLKSWGDTIKQMIGMAIKSKLTSYLFGGGSGIAGTAAAAATSADGGGAGGLAGAASAVGKSGLLGAFGSAGLAGSGFLGGLQASFSGGLGGFMSVGANAAAAGVSGVATLGSTLGALAGPLAAVALVFAAFKTKTTELDAGLKVTVNGFDALTQTFQTLEKKKFFGLSKKVSTTFADADAATSAAINAAVDQVQASVLASAASLGVAGNAFDAFSYSLQVSTKGLSQDAAVKAIQDKLTGLGDAMAGMVSGLSAFAKAGEGAATTLSRLAGAAAAVNQMTDTLGLSFKSVGLSGAGLAADLVDRFGSLDAMAAASQTYYQAFYSQAERTSILTRQTTAALAAMGLSLPATRDGFRALVEAQDLTTEAGRTTFAALLSVSGAIADILPEVTTLNDALDSTRKTLRAYIDDLLGTASELVSPALALASSTAAYDRALAATAAGESGAASELTSAATAMLAATRDSAGTALDVARAQAMVVAQLNAVAGGGLVSTAGSAPSLVTAAYAAPVSASVTTKDETISGLREEIAGLRDLIAQIGAETITHNKRSAEIAQKWDRDGMPAVRT